MTRSCLYPPLSGRNVPSLPPYPFLPFPFPSLPFPSALRSGRVKPCLIWLGRSSSRDPTTTHNATEKQAVVIGNPSDRSHEIEYSATEKIKRSWVVIDVFNCVSVCASHSMQIELTCFLSLGLLYLFDPILYRPYLAIAAYLRTAFTRPSLIWDTPDSGEGEEGRLLTCIR